MIRTTPIVFVALTVFLCLILEISESVERTDSTLSVSKDADETKITVDHMTEEITYSDEEIHIQYTDNLSLLHQMGQMDFCYAYRDGRGYYRQYHEDSFVEGAESAYYYPTAGTDKEIVRIDVDGEKTVLFSDKGYGNLYLICNILQDIRSLYQSQQLEYVFS